MGVGITLIIITIIIFILVSIDVIHAIFIFGKE